jgi:hypothetical protein
MALSQRLAVQSPQRRLLPRPTELLGLLLLAGPLLVTFGTIDAANWLSHFPPLMAEVVAAIVVSSYVVRLRWANRPVHALSLTIGLAAAIAQGYWLLRDDSSMVMAILLTTVTWWTTYLTVWYAYRQRSGALSLGPSLFILLVALAFLPSAYYLLVLAYLLAGAPALAYLHALNWKAVDRPIRVQFIAAGAGIASVVFTVAGAWAIPIPQDALRPGPLKQLEGPAYALADQFSGLLSTVPNRRGWPSFELQSDLPFTGPIALTDEVLMMVKSDAPHRWRMRVYETYSAQGWIRPSEDQAPPPTASMPSSTPRLASFREIVPIEVRTTSSMRLMASAGIPLSSANSAIIEFSAAPRFTLDLLGEQSSFLPPQLASISQEVVTAQLVGETDRVTSTLEKVGLQINRNLSPPLSLAVERSDQSSMPLVAVRFAEQRGPFRSYQTTGNISVATSSQLRGAPTTYPDSMADRYLQLPIDFPEGLKLLAVELADGHDNPYDIAISIQGFLQSLPYNTDIQAPPSGMDGVDWFINVQRSGFCMYYSSAMITMLRSLDIPARLVTGFAPGDWDEDRQAWVVKAKHYHAWPEVFFPIYGWVELEPTPANVQPSLQNLGFEYEDILDGLDNVEPLSDQLISEEEAFAEGTPFSEAALIREVPDNQLMPSADIGRLLFWTGGVVGAAMLIGIAFLLARNKPWRRRQDIYSLFFRMQLLAKFAGAGRDPHETPVEFGKRLAQLLPAHRQAVTHLAQCYTLAHYGRWKQLTPDQYTEATNAWPAIHRGLLRLLLRRLVPPFRRSRIVAAA